VISNESLSVFLIQPRCRRARAHRRSPDWTSAGTARRPREDDPCLIAAARAALASGNRSTAAAVFALRDQAVKMGSIVLKSLSVLLGIFFVFVGTMKLTSHISKELHKDLVSLAGARILLDNFSDNFSCRKRCVQER